MDAPVQEPKFRVVTVETTIGEPALLPATFDLLRTLARASDLGDVNTINVTIRVAFAGRCYEAQLSEYRHRLDQLWIADVVDVKEKE